VNYFYLDVEFDGKDLVSIALVPESDRYLPLYVIVKDRDIKNPWVAENVIPVLEHGAAMGGCAVGIDEARKAVSEYLRRTSAWNSHTMIVADWWTDILHLMRLIDHGDGTAEDVPNLFTAVVKVNSVSEKPHNALFDAMAIRKELMSKDTWRVSPKDSVDVSRGML
jgi:hypothetical protein